MVPSLCVHTIHLQVSVHVSHPGTAPASSAGTPAATSDSATGGATLAAATGPGGAAEGTLQPIASSSPDLSKAKGPLAAGRAASWRHPAAVAARAGPPVKLEGSASCPPAAPGLDGSDATAGQDKGVGAARGRGGLTGSMERSVWQQLFSCFQPPEIRAMGVA